jgi:exosortase
MERSVAVSMTTARAAERRTHWGVWVAVLGALILVLYGPILGHLIENWWRDPDYSHGFLVPLFSAYVLWRQRGRLVQIVLKPSNFGLVVMLGATALLFLGSLGAELFTSRISLLILIGGIVLFLAGWKMLQAVFFPLGFLVLMIPIPVIIYNQITFPLQLLASRFATFWLQLLGVPVLREGNLINLPNYTLEVVDACSGIRSLMTLITLAIAYGYFMEDRRWVRWFMVALMVPIAIASNSIRIVGAGLLTFHFGPRMAEGFFHEFSGWVIFVAALVLMFACHWALCRITGGQKQQKDAHA